MKPAALIEVRHLVKRFRRRIAIDRADLTVQAGEIHGLIGPDGAGKSSLMKVIAGVLTFDAGDVAVFGASLLSDSAAESVKDRIGFMPQGLGLNLYPDLSVEENLDFFAHLRLVGAAELHRRKERLLAMTRLGAFRTRPVRNLSGGMKQKLGLICTLVHEPRLLILDEPTTGVDPVSRRNFWDILSELLRERGTTALISTAYMDEASRFDRVSLMYGGKAIAHGPPDEICSRVRGTVVIARPQDQVAALTTLRRDFPQAEAVGSTIRVFVSDLDATAAIRKVAAAVSASDVRGLTASAPELEDAFVALLEERGPLEQTWTPDAHAGAVPSLRTPDDIAIQAAGLTKTFGDFTAASEVSFVVPQGQIFGLLGANGAGKTTVIKMLTGIQQPTQGTGRVAGADMRTASGTIKERIGYMSQSFSLYTDLTVLENIRLYAGVYGLDREQTRDRVQWVLDMSGLAQHQRDRAESLPMGLRQRLALGCALVHRPRVLFLDEPTAGVDVVGRRRFWETLFHLSRDLGVAILVTTHYMSEAEHCDQLALMHAGHIVASGSPAQMKQAVADEIGQILEFTTADPQRALAVLRAAGFPGATLFGGRVHIYSKAEKEDEPRVRELLQSNGATLLDTALRPLSMEDVFVTRVTRLEAEEGDTRPAHSDVQEHVA